MANRYITAWEAGDIDAMVAMLTDDATHAMPPWPAWFVGPDALRALYGGYRVWRGLPGPGVFRVVRAALNGQLGFAEYIQEEPGGSYRALAFTLVTLDPSGTHIAQKVSFVSPDLFDRLDFPPTLT